MKKLLSTAAAISTTEIMLLVVAFSKNKILALTVGPEGFGVYGLLQSFFSIAAIFAGSSLAFGATKYVAEYKSKGDNFGVNQTVYLSIFISSALTIFMIVILIFLQPFFIRTFLSDDIKDIYYFLYIGGLLSLAFRPLLIALLQGQMRVKAVVLSRIVISLVELFIIACLAYFFYIAGFMLGISISSIVAISVLFYVLLSSPDISLSSFRWNSKALKGLIYYGAINQILGIIYAVTIFLQRKIILENMDILSLGAFMAAFMAMHYMAIIDRGANFYFYPKMSEVLPTAERGREINSYLLLILMTNIPIVTTIILFSDLFIELAFSREFIIISPIFFSFVAANYFSTLSTPLRSTILGTGKLGMHSLISISINFLWIAVPFLLIKKYGLLAAGTSIFLGGVIGFFMSAMYLNIKMNISFYSQTVILIIYGFLALLLTIYFKDNPIAEKIVILFIIIFGQLLLLKKAQRRIAVITISNAMSNKLRKIK